MMREHVFRRSLLAAAVCTACGAGACLWGWLNEPQVFYAAWLCAFWYWLSMPLGALALLMIRDLTGGRWELVARRPLEALTATTPLFILAFLPLVAGMGELYSWSRPAVSAQIPNTWYLNPGFFGGRAAVYLVVWNLFAFLQLWRPHGEGQAPPSSQWVSGIGVMLMGWSVTFASIDWLMSIEPAWFSTVYGMMVGAAQFVVSLSLTLVVVALAGWPPGMSRESFGDHLANLATVLLAVIIFWAYCSFAQWLIIWEENLRFEITWYIERLRGAWESVLYTFAGAHFFLPFFALVWTPAKRSRIVVGGVCALILVADLLFVWWLVLPPFRAFGFSWLNPLAVIGLGGLWSGLFLWRLQYGRLLPERAAAPVEGVVNG